LVDQLIYAILGAKGSWSHAAAHSKYPTGQRLGCSDFEQVANSLKSGRADIAIFPVQNSTTGPIAGVFELLASHDFVQTDEIVLPIEHCLIGSPNLGVSEATISRIFSHPQGFLQCMQFLIQTYPNAAQIPETDTATAVQRVIDEGLATQLAIGSAFAAGLYGGKIIKADIHDQADNTTRFVCMVRR